MNNTLMSLREREAQQNVAVITAPNTSFPALSLIHVLIFIRMGGGGFEKWPQAGKMLLN